MRKLMVNYLSFWQKVLSRQLTNCKVPFNPKKNTVRKLDTFPTVYPEEATMTSVSYLFTSVKIIR